MTGPERTYYVSTVTGVGEEATVMIGEGVAIFFAEPVPTELAEVSVVHIPVVTLSGEIMVGDIVEVGGQEAIITAVGNLAADNLRTLGHVVLYRDPAPGTGILPGALHVQGTVVVPDVGSVIRLHRRETVEAR